MDGQDTKCGRKIAEIYNRLSRVHEVVHERYRQTTDRQTDDRRTDDSTFAKKYRYVGLFALG